MTALDLPGLGRFHQQLIGESVGERTNERAERRRAPDRSPPSLFFFACLQTKTFQAPCSLFLGVLLEVPAARRLLNLDQLPVDLGGQERICLDRVSWSGLSDLRFLILLAYSVCTWELPWSRLSLTNTMPTRTGISGAVRRVRVTTFKPNMYCS